MLPGLGTNRVIGRCKSIRDDVGGGYNNIRFLLVAPRVAYMFCGWSNLIREQHAAQL